MEIFIEQGESREDCMLKIASKYNRQFQILSQKEIRYGGFWGLFTKSGIQVEYYFTPQRNMMHNLQRRQHENILMEEEKKKVIAAANGALYSDVSRASLTGVVNAPGASKAASARQYAYRKEETSGRESSQLILDALKELKEKVESGSRKEDHSSFIRAEELLKANDFSQKFIGMMLEKLRKELPFDQLEDMNYVQDKLLEWIGESISIYKEETVRTKPKIMVLVGPTGVGKTTTISKLAAIYGIGTDETPAIDVRMITIDDFRICAKEQLEKIGNIMQIPVSYVDSRQELRKEIALHGEGVDMFLIDTIGKSPKDSSKLGEMKEILDGAGKNADFHLVISAGTKTKDIEDIMRQFEPFNYKSVIISKMDETDSVGNIISALFEKRKCVSFITNGQNLPEDIRRASVVRFLINLEGFKVNREKIEDRFPSGEADQFKWR